MTDYVKAFVLLPRRKDVSRQEFHDHWRHPHASWGKYMTGMPRYAQSHQIDCDLLDSDQTMYEGVVEAWSDSVEAGLALPNSPVHAAYIKPDEENFIDDTGLKFFFTREERLHPTQAYVNLDDPSTTWSPWRAPTATKLLQSILPESGPVWARDDDIELGRALKAHWHVRCHYLSEVYGNNPELLGVRELWWPHATAFREGVAAKGAWRELIQRPRRAITLLAQFECGHDYIEDHSAPAHFDKADRLPPASSV